MMMPEVGGIPKVSGSRSATPETGPTPGRAPMRVPRNTPATAMSRLKGVNAIEKPSARLEKRSMPDQDPDLKPKDAGRERYAEPPHENRPLDRGHADRHPERGEPRAALERPEEDSEEERGRERHADDGHDDDEG